MTGVTSKRISEVYTEIQERKLILRPPFQRRLVWTNIVKDKFLNTILLGLPFPEIFIATGELDTLSKRRTSVLVDGQQRISTLEQYILGEEDLELKLSKPYAELSEEEKRTFLDYEVAVRDLGTVTEAQIKDIFSRINSTDFSLKAIERLNAMFSGKYKAFCEELSTHKFFQSHKTFRFSDIRRMRDLDFCVILVTTLLSTYYHRDELNMEFLRRYNDDFKKSGQVQERLDRVFSIIAKCGFSTDSRVWKKTDLFTLMIEIDAADRLGVLRKDIGKLGKVLESFYAAVDDLYNTNPDLKQEVEDPTASTFATVFAYLKAATKATNDKYSRVIRGEIISKLLVDDAEKPNRVMKATKKSRKKWRPNV